VETGKFAALPLRSGRISGISRGVIPPSCGIPFLPLHPTSLFADNDQRAGRLHLLKHFLRLALFAVRLLESKRVSRKSSRTETTQHQVDHGEVDHRFAGLRWKFVVFGETTLSTQPATGTFDNPAAWQHMKTFPLIRSPIRNVCWEPFDRWKAQHTRVYRRRSPLEIGGVLLLVSESPHSFCKGSSCRRGGIVGEPHRPHARERKGT
jgi:hypothetical protein